MNLKGLVNNPPLFQSFLEELDTLVDKEHKILEQATDQVVIYRSQGAISALNKLKKLRDTINARDA